MIEFNQKPLSQKNESVIKKSEAPPSCRLPPNFKWEIINRLIQLDKFLLGIIVKKPGVLGAAVVIEPGIPPGTKDIGEIAFAGIPPT